MIENYQLFSAIALTNKYVRPFLSILLFVTVRVSYVKTGTSKVIERSQYCIEQVTDHLGLALGSTYVSRYFSQKSKKAVSILGLNEYFIVINNLVFSKTS